MEDQNKNLILATVLSFLVIMVWFVMFPPPEPVQDPNAATTTQTAGQSTGQSAGQSGDTLPTPVAPAAQPGAPATAAPASTATTAPRVAIDTPRLQGSLSLQGGRIDEILLKDYRETLDEGAEIVELLYPADSGQGYYALFGWSPVAGVDFSALPGPDTLWTAPAGATLTPDTPLALTWDNGAGLTFTREIAVDADYMFSITQSVSNSSGSTVTLAPYGTLTRHGEPADLKNFFILHEGLIAMADGELTETDYDGMTDYDYNDRQKARAETLPVTESGWIGFTDHYWMSTLIPAAGQPAQQIGRFIDQNRTASAVRLTVQDSLTAREHLVLIKFSLLEPELFDRPFGNLDQTGLCATRQPQGSAHEDARACRNARRIASSPLPSAKSPTFA